MAMPDAVDDAQLCSECGKEHKALMAQSPFPHYAVLDIAGNDSAGKEPPLTSNSPAYDPTSI